MELCLLYVIRNVSEKFINMNTLVPFELEDLFHSLRFTFAFHPLCTVR